MFRHWPVFGMQKNEEPYCIRNVGFGALAALQRLDAQELGAPAFGSIKRRSPYIGCGRRSRSLTVPDRRSTPSANRLFPGLLQFLSQIGKIPLLLFF